MIDPDIRVLVNCRLEQAAESLRIAELSLSANAPRDTINRAYYAMFYSVLALLAMKSEETSKHKGALSLFDMKFIKPGIFPKEFSTWLHDAFELRLDSDYAPLRHPSMEEAGETLTNARAFMSGIKTHLDSLLSQ
ncbi:MAG: HEPN domain-containing protein [Candidatus Sumerlaeota bacterium]|nr:HEPN domain-containing protein [Candidatus Sumerlaeota bacterium]